MNYVTPRLVNLYIFLLCAGLMGVALYMEHVMGLEPCPLCIMQRIFFIAAGLTALAAFVHNPGSRGRTAYNGFTALFSLAGAGFAIRQLYLQSLPKDQIPTCMPSLDYMLEVFPLQEVISVMLSGDGNCAEVVWRDPVLGGSIPQWSLFFFAAIAAVSIWQGIRK